MADKTLRAKHKWALLALMALQGEATNAALKSVAGFTLVNPERKELNDRLLVESAPDGRSFRHVLTDAGWAWCAEELEHGARPERSGSAGGATYAILGLLQSYLDSAGLSLAEFCSRAGREKASSAEPVSADPARIEPAAAQGIEQGLRLAYRKLATRPGKWVRLAELRSLLGAVDQSDVDETLRRMNRARQLHLVPESNQKALTQADREAAIRVGGQDSHLVLIEES